MRITTAEDQKVKEFLEYMGVGDFQWCQIRIQKDTGFLVEIEQGVGSKPPWHVERQQAMLLKMILRQIVGKPIIEEKKP